MLENVKKEKNVSSKIIIEECEELELVNKYVETHRYTITKIIKRLYTKFKYPINGEIKLLELKMYESIDLSKSQQEIDNLVWNYYKSKSWDILPHMFWIDEDSVFRNFKYINVIKESINILILSKGKYYRNVCVGLLSQIEELLLFIYILKRGDLVSKIPNGSIKTSIEDIIDYLEEEYNHLGEDYHFKDIIFRHLYAKSEPHIYNKDIVINRHKIFHGQGNDYINRSNVIRLFLIIRYLIWVYYDVHQNIIDNTK